LGNAVFLLLIGFNGRTPNATRSLISQELSLAALLEQAEPEYCSFNRLASGQQPMIL